MVGLIQGVTELFPVSSLGHNVLIPALIGGSWATDLNVAAPESPYLAFIVGLHVATAIALMIYFWRDWVRIIGGFFSSIRDREVETVDQKLAWMIILATIPVGLVGLVFEHEFRVLFGKPIRAAIFLVVNGLILYAGERFRTRKSLAADAEIAAEADLADARMAPGRTAPAVTTASARTAVARRRVRPRRRPGPRTGGRDARLGPAGRPAAGGRPRRSRPTAAGRDRLTGRPCSSGRRRSWRCWPASAGTASRWWPACSAACPARTRRASRSCSPRRSSWPPGVLKVPDLTGHLGNGIHGQILVGSILSGVGAYVSVRFLMKYFQTRTLTPFAIYCVVVRAGQHHLPVGQVGLAPRA